MYEKDIDFVLKRYRDLLGFDLSYMEFKVRPGPVLTDGSPCLDKDPDECAGDWTRLGWIRLNPDMRSVMRRYGVGGDVEEFARVIIAHELAHELWNGAADEVFKQDVLSRAASEGFTTRYLETVRPSKLREEKFCEYVARMVAGLEFRQVLTGGGELKALLREMPSYADNPRLNMSQFEKYLAGDGAFATLWYGCFDGGKCMSLAVLKRYRDDGVILLAEVQSAVKGYGRPLIEDILSRSRNIWWCADPDGGNTLVDYYRSFGVEEYLINRSKWVGGRPETAFYKAEDPEAERKILATLRAADMDSSDYRPGMIQAYKEISFPEDEISGLRGKDSFWTTRVSADFSKYGIGDVLMAPWGRLYVVTKETVVDGVRNHPFYGELTPEQRVFLGKYGRMKVLRLDAVGAESK